jgi:F-type H+-transporting ATPase subunit b
MVDLSFLAAAAGAVAEHHEEPSAWGFGPGAWVALSMLAVFGIMLYAKVPALVAGMLDKKIDGIRSQLAQAARLRSEAEALKFEYEKKVSDAAKHADALKLAAEGEAKLIIARAKDDATALIARRTKSAEDKIGAAERAAIADVRARVAAAATAAAEQMITTWHDGATDKSLVDATIARLN